MATTTVILDTTGPTAPIISPANGKYNSAVNVSLALASDASSTFFTITGLDPTTSSIAYNSGTLSVNGTDGTTKTFKVVSYDVLGNRSAIASTTYIFDKSAPQITITGENPVSIERGREYIDASATSTDVVDGDLTNQITTSSNVNILVQGAYSIIYSVSDSSGNITSSTRTVIVTPDITPPELMIIGSAETSVELETPYADAGATAIDLVDGDISAQITVTSNVTTSTAGTYQVVYTVNDSSGNTASSTRVVIVTGDKTKPVITLLGNTSTTIAKGSVYSDAGATATDNIDGTITSKIIITNSVNANVAGTYTVRYNVVDKAKNTANEVTRSVVVENDTITPVITLNGSSAVSVEIESAYYEVGATATDNLDGTIAVFSTSTVNTSSIGTYSVTYTATDSSGNNASATRTVNVIVDQTKPVITLLGVPAINTILNTPYTDAGATATDNIDGVITINIISQSNVDVNATGTYAVTYNVSDNAGNAANEITRTVRVVEAETDTTSPVTTLVGSSTIQTEIGSVYTDLGATATDNLDGDITANIVSVSTVNTNMLGTYSVTYNVSDAVGNKAQIVTRTVEVVDTTKPTITLLGSATVNVKIGGAYTERGATATDNVDGEIGSNILIQSNVNTNATGTYAVTYNVSDRSGNAADTVTRIVNVNPLRVPVISSLTPTNNPLFMAASSTIEMNLSLSDGDDDFISYNVAITSPTEADSNKWPVVENFTIVEPSATLSNFNAIGTITFTLRTREYWNNATLTVTAKDVDGNEATTTKLIRTR